MQVKPFSFPTDFNVITFDICCSKTMISYFVRVANYKVQSLLHYLSYYTITFITKL